MSPRIAALARIVIFAFVVILIPAAASAQTCPQPVIVADPDVCPGSFGTATAEAPPPGAEYTAFEWSIINGTLPSGNTSSSIPFFATGAGDVELTLTVTDANACQSSSSVTIPLASIPPPQIDLYTPSVCPGSSAMAGYATVAPPPQGITYQSFQWSIVNGTITYGETSSGASFTSTGTDPVELSVTVTDSRGCQATSSVTVPIRTLPPPQIDLYTPSICPGSSAMAGYAVVAPPAQGITYQSFQWSIVNGTITYGQTSSGASFTSTGNDPVELTVTVTDSYGCVSSNSVTVPIRTLPPPQIDLYTPSICPGSSAMGGYAVVAPPPAGTNYQSFQWSIVNGTITYGQTSSGVSFTSTGNDPVQLTVTVTDSYGCISSNSVTVPIRTLPPPQIDLYTPTICPGGAGGYAVVAPPPAGINYQSFEWSIVNGTITYGETSSGVSFTADGNGPVELTVTVHDSYGCVASNDVSVPLGGTPPPISLLNPGVCSTETNRASIDPSYSGITWSLANANILSGQGTPEIEFAGTGTGQITVSVSATNGESCISTNTIVVPFSALPIEIFAPESVCPGALMKVTASPFYGPSSFDWTITNATVEGPADQYELFFRADGSGPVTVTLSGTDYWGCSTPPSTVTIPLGATPVPDFQFNVSDICPIGYATAYLYASDDVYGSYDWTLTNARNVVIDGGYVAFEHEPGTGDVVVSLTVGEGSCTAQTVTHTLPVRPAVEPIIELATPTVCQNGTGTIYFENYNSFSHVSVYATNGTILSTGSTITFRSDGTGDVGITIFPDSNACNQARYFTVPMIPAPTSITPVDPAFICQGGSITLTASEGVSYLWSNGATTRSIDVTQAGNYTVTVTHANGCVVTSPGTRVFVNALPDATVTPSGPTTFCQGGNVTLTAPQSGYFLWSTGETTRSITVSTPGTYSVTVTSGSGCVKTSDPVAVTVNPNPAAGIQSTSIYDDPGSGTFTRNGDDIQACGNPTVRLIPQALDPSYGYNWSTGATTALLDVTTSGTYSVTVTTPGGCSTTSSVDVTYSAIPPQPAIAATDTELCPAGGSVTLTAPAADAWTWSNGATTQSIVVTEPGSYTVRVRNGACDSDLSEPVVITTGVSSITTSDPLALCGPGSSVTLTANAGTAWLWSDGATTQSIVVTEPGTFTVTTTNLGCTMPESDPVVVTARSVTIDAGGPLAFCAGDSVTLTASDGTAWLWSNGATTQSITVSESGSYGVTATYADGCSLAATPVTVEARQISATVVADRTTVCTNGAIQLTASAGGGAGYTYQWYDNTYAPIAGATSSTLTINPGTSGFVYVKVRDELGCEATSNSSIYTVVPTPDATITTAPALCQGQPGSASVADAGPGATYAWTITNGAMNFPNAPSVTFTPNGLDAVTLSVTVTNAGCPVSSSQTVTINPLPAISSNSGFGSVCWTETSAWHQVNNPPAGATFVWTVTDGTLLSGANDARVYYRPAAGASSVGLDVTMTNASGCSTSAHYDIPVDRATPESISASGPTTFCAGDSVTLTMPEAPAGWVYLWSTNATTQSITVSSSGTFTARYYKLAGGCAGPPSEPVTVTVNPLPTATITASGSTTFCAGNAVTLTASAGDAYLWSNGATTQSIDVIASGSYSVTVTNANGCSATSSPQTVTVHDLPAASITGSGDTTFCAGESVTLTASDGTSWLWSNGATTQSIDVIASGTFTVTVTNANGCASTSSPTTVTVHDLPAATITAAGDTTFCAGQSVTLTASDGTSWLWSNGATTQSIDVIASGTFTVTVTNENGCSATSSPTTVTVHDLPAASITASGDTTFCAGDSVTLTASDGTSWLWSNGATTQSIDVIASGSYSVTVTNANGCASTSDATTVTVNALPDATISHTGALTFCAGESVTLSASAGTSYVWSTGETSQSIEVFEGGSYTVVVTGANGCSATSQPAVVTVNAKPQATVSPAGSVAFCVGGSVTLTASAGASWLWSNGATSRSIEVFDGGSYFVIVTYANGCSSTSAATTVTEHANPATPTISAAGSTTFCDGGSVELIAPAGFASYLWSTGETAQSITVDASGNYTVTVANANGCPATSAPRSVIENPATSIFTQPQSKTIPKNTTTTLSVVAAGTGPFTYQWYRGSSPNTSQPIGGATSSSYTTPKLNRGTYTYWVRVTGGCGVVNSNTATIIAQ